jgi:hypothetical protein
MESYCSLCTFKVPQGANNLIVCTLDTIHRLFFVTRLIINQINKVQWVDFKLENVLVSLHSFKTMGLGPFGASTPLFLRNGELLGHSPIRNNFIRYLRNKSWKSECVLSFNMDWRILVFYPEPEAFADNVANNLCCPIRADDNISTGIFTTGKSVTWTGACANETIPNL